MDRNPPVASRFRGSPPKLDVTLVAIQAPGEAKKADKKKKTWNSTWKLLEMYVCAYRYVYIICMYIYIYIYI